MVHRLYSTGSYTNERGQTLSTRKLNIIRVLVTILLPTAPAKQDLTAAEIDSLTIRFPYNSTTLFDITLS